MPENNKKTISIAIVIALISTIFGWNFYRLEKIEERNFAINSIFQQHEKANLETFGQINTRLGTIDNNLTWLKNMMDEYKKANKGGFNISDFFQALESGKIKSGM